MAIKNVVAKKPYDKDPYLLTEAKLSRIVEIARNRLDKVRGDKEIVQGFKVSLSNNKEIETSELSQVFLLDNSVKNPVIGLSYSALAEKSLDQIAIGFSDLRDGIDIIVRSEDFAWRSETIGALEEQVDRVIQRDIAYKLRGDYLTKIVFVLVLILMFALLLGTFSITTNPPGRLSHEDALALSIRSTSAVTDSEKLDVVFSYVKSMSNPGAILDLRGFLSSARTYFIGVPALVTVAATLFTLMFFYPMRVFAWGDWKEHHDKLVERRKFMWGSVVFTMIVSVFTTILGAGIFPPK
jgi:hypothetical protein